jgi:hypothetical protein
LCCDAQPQTHFSQQHWRSLDKQAQAGMSHIPSDPLEDRTTSHFTIPSDPLEDRTTSHFTIPSDPLEDRTTRYVMIPNDPLEDRTANYLAQPYDPLKDRTTNYFADTKDPMRRPRPPPRSGGNCSLAADQRPLPYGASSLAFLPPPASPLAFPPSQASRPPLVDAAADDALQTGKDSKMCAGLRRARTLWTLCYPLLKKTRRGDYSSFKEIPAPSRANERTISRRGPSVKKGIL